MSRYLSGNFLLSLASFVITVLLIYVVLMTGLRLETSGHAGVWKSLVEGKINADLLVGGDSRVLSGVDCEILESALKGTSCFNIGLNGSGLNLQLPYLKTYLRHNRKPRVMVHDVSMLSAQCSKEIDTPDQYVLYLNEKDLYDTLAGIDPVFRKIRHVPMYAFFAYGPALTGRAVQGYLDRFGPGSRAFRITDKDVNRVKGYWPRDMAWTADFEEYKKKYPRGQVIGIETCATDALESIIQLAQSNGIPLILLYPPEYHEAYPLILNRDKILQTFKDVARQHKVPFWDYSGTPLTKDTRYFYNSQHMNKTGAEEFSRELAIRLKEYMSGNSDRWGVFE